MSTQVVTSLEVLFTANTKPVDDAAKNVENRAKKIEKSPVKQTVDGDAKGALAAMDRVESEAKKIVSAKTIATVDANIERAETGLTKVQERLDYLRSVESTMEVTADIKRAESALKQITRRRDALVSARESMVIDADTSPAEAAIGGLADDAGEAGAEGGEAAGKGLGDGITDALKTLPIAGAVVLAGVAIGKAVLDGINDGLQVEVRRDRLQALTGITEEDARRFAMASGEAYADAFGESIEANMDTARVAIQSGILDEGATVRQSESVIKGLAGIADVLGEDVKPVATAVTQLLRTGLAKSADEAFDLLATGAREGVNISEDLLDTFTEYPALFARLGLSGPEALGLINQGLEAGARNSDLAADALKEFQIRATDGSETSAAAFRTLGLDAEDMTAKIAAGGAGAREGLDQVLTGLREMEDPVARNAAAVGLFGTQAEDLGAALFAMDLTTAVDQLDGVTGAAQRMFDTLADNDATKLEEAQRNIEVAMDAVKGALAGAFSEPLADAAEWVSENRGPLLEFFSELVNGALDFGVAAVNGAASATEAFGRFVAGPLASTVDGLAGVLDGLNGLPFVNLDDEVDGLQSLADGMRDFDDTTDQAADNLRAALIPGIEDARDRFNEMFDPQVDMGYLNDATRELASAVADVGYAAEGSTEFLSGFDRTNLTTTESGRLLEEQIRAAVDALDAQTEAGQAAGEGQDELTARYEEGREALIRQLEQMGLSRGEAEALAEAYGAIPGKVETDIKANAEEAQRNVDELIARNQGKVIRLSLEVSTSGNPVYVTAAGTKFEAQGDVLEFYRAGGVRQKLTPMAPVAQMVPANTWRVVGDRPRGDEAYIPIEYTARSLALLDETAARLGRVVVPVGTQFNAAGSITPRTGQPAPAAWAGPPVQITVQGGMTTEGARTLVDDLPWLLATQPGGA
ncbi:phage tail tape measure protein [Cellulomonas sp. ES6]|uniref:phage tail tape measure protein n=1 Tax=Cellulomonas sp. ES6 TaxID=3039384 RepID=UPI0024B7AD7B|nr:phage tail tape measure protein [Cellulomonas sp. ES6]WHP18842.1 phage tail tape measure protein [Cellulomonas sp. ES6]